MNIEDMKKLSVGEKAEELSRRWAGMRDQMRNEGLENVHAIMHHMRTPDLERLSLIFGITAEEAKSKAKRVGEILLNWMPDDVFEALAGRS